MDRIAVQQSGVVPYRWRHANIEVLLVTNRSARRWIVPKGHIEPDMTPMESAAREAYEEAGVRGTVIPTVLGTLQICRRDRLRTVELYPLHVEAVLDHWPECDRRCRQWVTWSVAMAMCDTPGFDACLGRLAQLQLAGRLAA
ncbi:MAG: NUDIX hydrolase [Planctomycetota bacterium]